MGAARRRAPTVIETEIDGDISLYDPSSETVAVLNSTASDIWRLCDDLVDVEEAVVLLAKAYGVPPGEIAAEVEKAIDDLTRQGFLRLEDPSAPRVD